MKTEMNTGKTKQFIIWWYVQ